MSTLRRIALGLGGLVAAAGAAGFVAERDHTRRRSRLQGSIDRLGSLRGEARTVRASDGVGLHVEVDEPGEQPNGDAGELTIVFVHGYALNHDCWHHQRAWARKAGIRAVLYDQRSHGRSERSEIDNATIEQLGRDLARVIDEACPGPVVLVGHSMGGMTLLALAEERPELFGEKVVGVALVSTTAGGLNPGRVLAPFLPADLSGTLAPRAMAALSRVPAAVDLARRRGTEVGTRVISMFAFGERPDPATAIFVDEMIAQTSFEVLAEFFDNFGRLDKFTVLDSLAHVPTVIVCGTRDKLTSIGHSRKMASLLPTADLIECEGAGHMVILEQPDEVNAALATLVERASAR